MSWPTKITMPSHFLPILTLLSILALLVSCSPEPESSAPASTESSVELTAAAELSTASVEGEWGAYAADNSHSKYSPLDQIDASNVAELEIAWKRPALDAYYSAMNPRQGVAPRWTSAPIVKNGIAYVPNGVGLVEAFNPGTGETIWVQEPHGGVDGLPGSTTRGVAYWSEGNDRRILVQRGIYLYALNADNGQTVEGFGVDGRVNLSLIPEDPDIYHWGGVPTIVRDVVVIGRTMIDKFANKEAFRGDVYAFDVRTGEMRWTFNTIPQEGQFGTESWQDRSWSYSGHAPVWSLFSADEELGHVYMPISSSTNDMYGGHRIGDNLFSQSLVAVDAETGERVWHYQTVHHGLWDYDLPTAPILMDIIVDGEPVKAITQLTKQAFAFVFNRETGEPIWEIEERAVPQSDVPGEVTSPTQPFPTRPAPFDRQGATVDNLIDFTPELRAEALEIFNKYVTGPLFTPPSILSEDPAGTQGTIQLPGSVGGADVQGAAFDPETGYLYIPSISSAFVADILPGDPEETNLAYVKGVRRWITGPRGLPLFKPPYGRITAIDMNTGEHVWMVPNGDGPIDHPDLVDLELAQLGVPGRPSPLLTKTLLFIGEGLTNKRPGGRIPFDMPVEIAASSGGPLFRAYDKDSGNIVWEVELDAGTTGPPITYLHEGEQFILVAIGDRLHSPELVAFKLP